MEHHPPTAIELVEAVRAFLEDRVLPEVQGRTAFHARVAANALGIVLRELEAAPQRETLQRRQLVALLSVEDGGQCLRALERILCERIRHGALTLASPELRAYLWEDTWARLAVDQPSYRPHEGAGRAPASRRSQAPNAKTIESR